MKQVDRLAFVERVLRAVAFDYCDDLWWRDHAPEDPTIRFYINCNDIFAWACSDCEEVTPDKVQILEEAIRDCENAFDGTAKYHGGGTVEHLCYGPTLFVARVRNMRPQGAVLNNMKNPKVRALFDACGPKRDSGTLGNPYAHPEDGGAYEYPVTVRHSR